MAPLVRLLSLAIAWMGAAALLPALVAVRLGEEVAPAFFATAVTCAFLTGAMRFAAAGLGGPMRRLQAFGALAGLWVLVPLVAAPAIAVASGLDLWRAWFEALSAFTTTGFTALEGGPRSLYVWLGLLQWSGGLLTIVSGVAVLAPAGIGGLPDRAQRLNAGGELVDASAVVRDVGPIYAGATGVAFLAMMMGGQGLYPAFCLATALTSAGAHLPPEALAAVQTDASARWLMLPFLIWAATSVRWHRALVGRRIHAAPEQGESLLLIGYFLVLGVVLSVMLFRQTPEMSVGEAWSEGLFAAASLISTSGLAPSPAGFAGLPLGLLLFVTLIGGGALSVAGGLKILRVRAMALRARGDLTRLISPNLVQPARTGEGGVGSAMRGVWVATVALFATLGVVLVLMASSMPSFEAALSGAVAALTNTGPLYDEQGAGWPAISSLPPWSVLAAAFAMIAGRLEIVGAFVLIHFALRRS